MKYVLISLFVYFLLITIIHVLKYTYRVVLGSHKVKDVVDEADDIVAKMRKYQERLKDSYDNDGDGLSDSDLMMRTMGKLVEKTYKLRLDMVRNITILRGHNYNHMISYIKLLLCLRKARSIISELDFVDRVWREK